MPEHPNPHHQPDVIYLEADSEITEAIDKLKASHGHEVRIAVPARSTMLQSAVNLKLLKKTAHTARKELVLVSTDKATLSLAAGLGLPVAKNIKAEASVPDTAMLPPEASNEPIVIEQASEEASSKQAKKSARKSDSKDGYEKQHINLDDETEEELPKHTHQGEPFQDKTKKGGPKVPNFMGLNKKIGTIVAIACGLILLVLAYIFLPTAKATLLAKAQKTPVNVKFTLDSSTRRSDFPQGLVAANQLSVTKDLSAQYTATGQKDVGTKASGSVAINNSSSSSPVSIPAGTVFTASSKSFTLNQAVTVPGATLSGGQIVPGKVNGQITASANGDSSNLSNPTFSIAGFGALVTATGSTSGGTSKIATVVTQADIDKAKKDMIDAATQNAKQEVEGKANNDEKVFPETFTSVVTGVTASSAADSESSGGTVSAKVKYSELAAAKTDLDKLFLEQIKTQIPGNNQVYQSGASDAKYSVKLASAEKSEVTGASNAYYGQSIDTKQVARDLSGKAKKDATDIVKVKYPQVTGVQVESSPALTPNLPFFSNRITVEIKVSTD